MFSWLDIRISSKDPDLTYMLSEMDWVETFRGSSWMDESYAHI